MAWFVYDYDDKGSAIQRGPVFSEGEAQRILDGCENQSAFKVYWKTRQRSEAKAKYRELMRSKGKTNSEVLCNIWNGESYDKRREKVKSIGSGSDSSLVNMPDPYAGIREIKEEIKVGSQVS